MKVLKDKQETNVVTKGLRVEELPSIYRTITDLLLVMKKVVLSRAFVVGVLSVFLLGIGGLIGARLLLHGQELTYLIEARGIIAQSAFSEQSVVARYPGYRDGYFAEAMQYYRLGDIEKSSMYLEKAMQLDPNFPQGKRLAILLGEK